MEKIHSQFNIPVVCLIEEITEDLIEQLACEKQFECIFQPYETNQLRLGIENSLRRHRKLQRQKAKEAELESTIKQLTETYSIHGDRF